MLYYGTRSGSVLRSTALALLAVCLVSLGGSAALGQDLLFARPPAVGGVSVNTEGVLDNATVDDTGRLARLMQESLQPVPPELAEATEIRKISLRRLEEAIAAAVHDGKPLSDEMRYLAGLQEIQYVFVDAQHKDIILAGPGEGWKVDQHGAVVGVTTGRPVMLLDDLLVALRTARAAMDEVITCSIDPQPEGITRLRQYLSTLETMGNPAQTQTTIEKVLGPQKITVTVVPDTSHFARVMVAADYRMKRLGMHLDRSPVTGLPSFLEMLKSSGGKVGNMLPRWWLEPRYESVMQSPDGLAWELRGASVRAMSEADYVNAAGHREKTVAADPLAQRWANLFTEKYDKLAVADPVFGQLRNCMQLAIVSALIVKEDLTAKAGYSLPTLLDPTEVEIEKLPAPKQVDSVASALRSRRGNWIVSASGGVAIDSYAAIKNVKENASLAAIRTKATGNQPANWWWN
ncbi:MAG: DUF1598 domain-containing protein [Pirellulales bacterium]|nr:DUF1598 domain-containing protein [Pirellulales bacterium]